MDVTRNSSIPLHIIKPQSIGYTHVSHRGSNWEGSQVYIVTLSKEVTLTGFVFQALQYLGKRRRHRLHRGTYTFDRGYQQKVANISFSSLTSYGSVNSITSLFLPKTLLSIIIRCRSKMLCHLAPPASAAC